MSATLATHDPAIAAMRQRCEPGAVLAGMDLSGMDLSGVDLSGADLSGARLCGADLTGAELVGANLTGADLREACFRRAGLAATRLVNCNATGACFDDASLAQADLTETDADLATFRGARLHTVNLTHAHFTKADFSGAELFDFNAQGAGFRDAEFDAAKLRGARNFSRSDWVHADLRKADLSSAQLLRRHAADQNYLWEFRRQSRSSEWLYRLWWLTSDCGRSFARWGLMTALVAIVFAGIYRVVGVDFGPNETVLSPLYFSIVTLTTLGYGDVLPTTTTAQVMVMIETITGYVMLGGLLAMFSSTFARRA